MKEVERTLQAVLADVCEQRVALEAAVEKIYSGPDLREAASSCVGRTWCIGLVGTFAFSETNARHLLASRARVAGASSLFGILVRRYCRSFRAPVTESQCAHFRIASPCLVISRRLFMTPTSALAITPSGLALHFGQERLGRAQGLAAVRHRPQALWDPDPLFPQCAVPALSGRWDRRRNQIHDAHEGLPGAGTPEAVAA
jgi:hypothetical protein